jgi:tetratricopeptide (TPR) repeat protein
VTRLRLVPRSMPVHRPGRVQPGPLGQVGGRNLLPLRFSPVRAIGDVAGGYLAEIDLACQHGFLVLIADAAPVQLALQHPELLGVIERVPGPERIAGVVDSLTGLGVRLHVVAGRFQMDFRLLLQLAEHALDAVQGRFVGRGQFLEPGVLVSGLLPKANGFDYLAASDVARLLPDADLLDEALYNDMAGSPGGSASFSGLQPDILGERFVLDRVSAKGIAGQNARRLLLAAWSFQPRDVGMVAVHSAFDFHGDQGLYKLFDLPLDSREARTNWAEMVSDLIALLGGVRDDFSQQQLQELISLADRHPQEGELQEAAARADYNIGSASMFRENDIPTAIERFDAAIARVGNDSLIAKMAIHNRGILSHRRGENDNAFNAYTMMIESREASDEMRACAFNNRADVYAGRGEHDNAIRDRTEVLALKDTSSDRRYIALFRRSRSYSAIGNDQAALNDLDLILKTRDISPRQKAEARLERAGIMRHLERWDEARADLEAVINSSYLFSGTRAMALVELAEVSRRTGDHAQAENFLSLAVEDPEAREETLVEAMIVGALLLENTGNLNGACEMWQSVLAAPSASDTQMRTAQRRLDAISPCKREGGEGVSPS